MAEERRFSSAARRLHVATPSVSQQIRALERDLRVTLFDRTPRGAELTAAGRVLAERARVILAEVDRAREDVRSAALSSREQVTPASLHDGRSGPRRPAAGGGHRDPGRRGRRDVQPGGRRRRGGPAGAGRCSGRLEPPAGAPGPRRHRPRFGAVRRRPAAGSPARRPGGDPRGGARPRDRGDVPAVPLLRHLAARRGPPAAGRSAAGAGRGRAGPHQQSRGDRAGRRSGARRRPGDPRRRRTHGRQRNRRAAARSPAVRRPGGRLAPARPPRRPPPRRLPRRGGRRPGGSASRHPVVPRRRGRPRPCEACLSGPGSVSACLPIPIPRCAACNRDPG